MTLEQRQDVQSDLTDLAMLIETAASTRNIVGGMVQVIDTYDYAFIGKFSFRRAKLVDTSEILQTSVDFQDSFEQ